MEVQSKRLEDKVKTVVAKKTTPLAMRQGDGDGENEHTKRDETRQVKRQRMGLAWSGLASTGPSPIPARFLPLPIPFSQLTIAQSMAMLIFAPIRYIEHGDVGCHANV